MQRLLSLGQRRPPFPSSFFTSSSSSGISSSSSNSYRALSHQSLPGCSIRHQSFGDSSRSRPPSNKSSNGGASSPKPSSKNASKAVAATSTSSSNEASSPSTSSTPSAPSSGSVSAARKARSQRANSRNTSTGQGRRMRIDPFTNEGLSSSSVVEGSSTWLPRSIKPVDILRTHPSQISLDGFYALNRPLLQITVSPKSRHYPSSTDKNNNSKMMEIVRESEFSEEQIKAGQQDPFAEDQIGPFDLNLITEPDGADPEWAKGTDKHMATLEHNVLPPLPTPSTSSSSSSTPTTTKKSNKKQSKRQEAIDFLFPIQAEVRKAEQEAREQLLSSSSSSTGNDESTSLGSQIQQLLNMHEYELDLDINNASMMPSRNSAHQFDAMAGSKFLVGQLMKHRWSGMWEWEPTRRALVAASASNVPSAPSTGKGKAKAEEQSLSSTSSERTVSLQTSLDKLRKLSLKQARKASKAAEKRGGRGILNRSPMNGEILTAANGDDFKEMLDRLAKDPKSQGKTIFIQMPLDGLSQRASKKNKKNNNKKKEEESSSSLSTILEEEGNNKKMNKKDSALLGEEEVKQVLEQVKKFQGFFDKSIDSELQSKAARQSSTSASTSSSADAFNDVSVDAKLVGLEWDSPSHTESMSKQEQDDGISWYAEERPSESMINARFSLLGSRMSNAQAYRGRSLRPTLRERLSLRDVDLIGAYKWKDVEMDSVKRKRRKRISKHKYKKRRKATRAERRRIGK